ncbi:MAG: SMEK domain-containing protein [Silanimonas sp.]|nr:SMEK domain-containing protein [Silanimonas sp.]
MITRGYLIGEIIDELATIAAQTRMRNRSGFTDLSIFAENFFRDLLTPILHSSLENLNNIRSNSPGIDLGSKDGEFAIQVTSVATSDKVNKTLAKLTEEQIKRYQRFVVLVIGEKQGSYTIEPELASKAKFEWARDVWDMDTIAKMAVDLPIERLQDAHRVVRANGVRLRVELEMPDENGVYPTSGYTCWEESAEPRIGSGESFSQYQRDMGAPKTDIQISNQIAKLCRSLSALPRVTREFLVVLLEKRQDVESVRFKKSTATVLLDRVKREYTGSDLAGELRLLESAGLIIVETDVDPAFGLPLVGINLSAKCDDLNLGFLDFVQAKNLSLREVIGKVDFSRF